ncbi:MAG: 30S ribosomal protein S6 [Thermoflexia bacterium]|nr:MAG: 30S ribosomal protein S6 [Thermoflexia bacterium]
MRRYELTYIVHPQMNQAGLEAVIADVKNLIEANGGTVHKVEPWGLRRLAYPIRKVREGYYVLMDIGLNGSRVAEVERGLKLREPIMRYLFVRTDEGKE